MRYAAEYANRIVKYQDRFSLLTMRRCGQAEGFLLACLRQITQEQSARSFFTAQFFLQNWTFLRSGIASWLKESKAFYELIGELSAEDAFVDEICQAGFDQKSAGLYKLFVDHHSSKIASWCTDNLTRLSKIDWLADIEDRGDLVSLAISLKQAEHQLDLTLEYDAAVIASVERVLTGDSDDEFSLLFDNKFLLKPLDSERQIKIRESIYKAFKATNAVPIGFFSSYGEFLDENVKNDAAGLSSICSPLLERRDSSGLRWLSKLIERTPTFLDNYADVNEVNLFKRHLLIALSHEPDEATPSVIEIARAIGIRKLELPPLPWTHEALGKELYNFIAREGGYFDPEREPPSYRPDLGPLGPIGDSSESGT